MKRIAYVFSFFFLSLSFWGCDEGTKLTEQTPYDLASMLQHIGENIIVQDYHELQGKAQRLAVATEAFSQEANIEHLQRLKSAFIEAYMAYQRVSMYEFGPAMDQGFSFRDRLNVFPTNTENIENNITSELTDIDANFKSTVGFPAVEYMLYDLPGTSEDEVIQKFANDSKRSAYLLALVNNASEKVDLVANAWNGNYLATFIANTGNSEGSSLGMIVNELNFDFETLKNFKFRIPLGKFDGGIIQPQKAEGYYSGLSLILAKEQLDAMNDLYLGETKAGIDGEGLDEYLIHLDAGADQDGLLAEAIRDQFQVISQGLNLLSGTLTEELTNNKAAVDEAHIEMQKMVPFLKREMTSALGIKITYQDNDGD